MSDILHGSRQDPHARWLLSYSWPDEHTAKMQRNRATWRIVGKEIPRKDVDEMYVDGRFRVQPKMIKVRA